MRHGEQLASCGVRRPRRHHITGGLGGVVAGVIIGAQRRNTDVIVSDSGRSVDPHADARPYSA
jgi:hypothetical protein